MKSVQESRIIDMTNGKPLNLLLRFSVPLFLGNLLQQFYNLADTSLAGHLLGDSALAQIGATAALYSLITNFAFGLNNGLALTVSRYFGAGDKVKLKQSICWMIVLSTFFSAFLTIFFFAFRHSMLEILQVPSNTMCGALSYLTVILAGIPLTMAYNLEASLLQALGNSVTPLILLLFSSVLNIFLDGFFMGPLSMDVQGAAIATILAQGISAIGGCIYIGRNYKWLHFQKQDWKVSFKFIFQMLETGLSMAFMNTIYNIGSVILQSSINALGEVYIAAQVGARRLAELFYIPGSALGTSAATYTSQNYGANKRQRIKHGMWAALFLYGIWWPIALAFTFTFATDAIILITGSHSQEVISNAEIYLKIAIPMIPPMAVLVILRNIFQGMNHVVMPLLCSTLELIGKVFFALYVVPTYGYLAVCICEPITWIICAILIVSTTYRNRKKYFEEKCVYENNQAV